MQSKIASKSVEGQLRVLQILIAGLLLKQDPKPNVKSLAKLIGVGDGLLSEIFPQRAPKKRKNSRNK